MNINHISQKAASFIQHKTFHPGNWKNLKAICQAELDEEKRIANKLYLSERKDKEHRLAELRNCDVGQGLSWIPADDQVDLFYQEDNSKAPNQLIETRFVEYTPNGVVDDSDIMMKLLHDPLTAMKGKKSKFETGVKESSLPSGHKAKKLSKKTALARLKEINSKLVV